MKVLIWLLCLLGEAIVYAFLNDIDVAYGIADFLKDDPDEIALFAGIIAGVIKCITVTCAFSLAFRLSKRWGEDSFHKRAKKAGLTDFQYARKIANPDIINYCESNLHKSASEITRYLENQVNCRKLKKQCANVLIRVYSQNAGRTPPDLAAEAPSATESKESPAPVESNISMNTAEDLVESGRNVIRIAGRDGAFREETLSDKEYKALITFLDLMGDFPHGT